MIDGHGMSKTVAIVELAKMAPDATAEQLVALLVAVKALARAIVHKNRNKAARQGRRSR